MDGLEHYCEIWLADFEFRQPDGERPEPICFVARELKSGKVLRFWKDELFKMKKPPFSTLSNVLFVAYYASAELSCFLALGWPMPERILDLYVEFRNHSSGLPVQCGNGLLGALAYHGLDAIDAAEKDTMRDLAMRGGEFADAERTALLDYCQSDVNALARLLPAMLPRIDLCRALLRGRFMAAAAMVEWAGVPIDVETYRRIQTNWTTIQSELIAAVDRDFGVYAGRTFKQLRFEEYLSRHGITWPRLPSGALMLDDDTFKTMAKAHESLWPLRELRHTLSEMRLNALSVGADGRNRTMLSAFKAKTSRNQPSNSKFIFGPSTWLRSLIKPDAGRAVAYVDYEQQEFGIAAALSGDKAMQTAYASGDPYLAFAKQAGAIPAEATKKSHAQQREQFKVCSLAVQYGMSAPSLALSLGQPEFAARELLRLHHQTYPAFWRWTDGIVAHAMLKGYLHTVFGWRVHVAGDDANIRSLANFPMQGNGAEMLRLACCLAIERNIMVCAPVHDAILIEADIGDIEAAVITTQAAMREASETVLNGFALRTDAKVITFPNRYSDDRGKKMWATVIDILETIVRRNTSKTPSPEPVSLILP